MSEILSSSGSPALDTSAHSPGLDLLRALAVSMVLIFHFSSASNWQLFNSWGRLGWMGVDLFFVLSGYLIGSQLFRAVASHRPLKLKSFFLRRVFRTFPSFFVVVFVYFVFAPLREKAILPPLWKFLTFTQNFWLDRYSAGAFSHAWSLCLEEQFYLFLPLFVLLLRRSPSSKRVVGVMLSLFAVGIVARLSLWWWVVKPSQATAANFASYYDEYIYYPTYARLDGLLVGTGLALIENFRSELWRKWLSQPWRAGAVSFCCMAVAIALNNRKFSFAGAGFLYPCVALSFGALLVVTISPECWWARIRIPGVAGLASLSYGVYLVQKLVFHWSETHLQDVLGLEPLSYSGFAATVLLCLLVAFALSTAVEQPFLKWRERIG